MLYFIFPRVCLSVKKLPVNGRLKKEKKGGTFKVVGYWKRVIIISKISKKQPAESVRGRAGQETDDDG